MFGLWTCPLSDYEPSHCRRENETAASFHRLYIRRRDISIHRRWRRNGILLAIVGGCFWAMIEGGRREGGGVVCWMG